MSLSQTQIAPNRLNKIVRIYFTGDTNSHEIVLDEFYMGGSALSHRYLSILKRGLFVFIRSALIKQKRLIIS